MSIDPRGPRFAAWLTSTVLAAVLLTGSGWLLAAQAVVFASAAVFGMRRSPYGWLYRTLLAPRLAPPAEREAEAPVRFAQGVGLAFALVGAVGYLSGPVLSVGFVVGTVAAAMALVAAFLNAAFGFCLGCEMYLTYLRLTRKGATA